MVTACAAEAWGGARASRGCPGRGGRSVRPKNLVLVFGFSVVRSLETQDRISSKKKFRTGKFGLGLTEISGDFEMKKKIFTGSLPPDGDDAGCGRRDVCAEAEVGWLESGVRGDAEAQAALALEAEAEADAGGGGVAEGGGCAGAGGGAAGSGGGGAMEAAPRRRRRPALEAEGGDGGAMEAAPAARRDGLGGGCMSARCWWGMESEWICEGLRGWLGFVVFTVLIWPPRPVGP